MSLEAFPLGILVLNQLKEIYIRDAKFENIPEEIMNLKHLKVLSLPAIKQDNLSPQLSTFIEKLSPHSKGIGLREILGEEKWQEILAKGDYIMSNQ